MGKYILKRLILTIPVVLGVTILIFTIMYFTPGDPARIILGPNASFEQVEAKNKELGLDKSYGERLVLYMKNVFLHFDLGRSYVNNRSVSDDIKLYMPRTLRIAFWGEVLALLFGIPLGVVAAINRNTWKDRLMMIISLLGVSMPSFWVALLLVILFSVKLGWLPSSGLGGIKAYIMPCLACALGGFASVSRQTRSSMLEVINSDYIVTARTKGQTEMKVIYKHALRNALIPVVTVAGMSFGMTLGGAIIIETIFSIPGLGMYMVSAINARDYPAIQGAVIIIAIAFSLIMLVVDIIYAFLDPRIRNQYSGK